MIKRRITICLVAIAAGLLMAGVGLAAENVEAAGAGGFSIFTVLKYLSLALSVAAIGAGGYFGWIWKRAQGQNDEEGMMKAKRILIYCVLAFLFFLSLFIIFNALDARQSQDNSRNGSNNGNGQANNLNLKSCDSNKETPQCDADPSFCGEGEFCGSDCTCEPQGGLNERCGPAGSNAACVNYQNSCQIYLSCAEDNDGYCSCLGGPVIKSVSPLNSDLQSYGAPGDYITISGAYFGTATGSVYFSDSEGQPRIKAEWPSDKNSECQSDWQETQIVAAVPAMASSGPIKVIRSDGEGDMTSDERGPVIKDFAFREKSVRPSLCQLSSQRARTGDSLETYGINYGAEAGLFSFGGVEIKGTKENWSLVNSQISIPDTAIPGYVEVINSQGARSNQLAFSIGSCQSDGDCAGGEACCEAETYWEGICRPRGSCDTGRPGESGFGWSFTTHPPIPKKCGGYDASIDACIDVYTCPNSPGQCRNSEEKIVGRGCGKDYCGYNYKNCANGTCSYDPELNKCVVDGLECQAKSTEILAGYESECRLVNGKSVWQYKPIANYCAAMSAFMDKNGWCTLGSVYEPKTCSLCPSGFACEAGKCQSFSTVCPENSTCNDNSQCILDESANTVCECCCRVGETEDCCAGLQCEPGNCGSGAPSYGLCTGCRKDGDGDKAATSSSLADVNASNALCNCKTGFENRYCDMDDSRYPTGVCRDMAEAGESCRDISGSVCGNLGFSLCSSGLYCDSEKDCVCRPAAKEGEKCCDPADPECGGATIPCAGGLECSPESGYVCVPESAYACGNGVVEPGETCDGSNWGNIKECNDFESFSGGKLACGSDCHFITGQCVNKDPSIGGFCGDGKVQRGEECDGSDWGRIGGCADFDNFTGGKLSCGSDCRFNTAQCAGGTPGVCGDNKVNIGETCDGRDWGNIAGCSNFDGFTDGRLLCDPYCHFNTGQCEKNDPGPDGFCGDGLIQRGEECDGRDLNNKRCGDIGDFSGGSLSCGDDCFYDTARCIDASSGQAGSLCQKGGACTSGASGCSAGYQCLTGYDNLDCRCCCDPDSGTTNSAGLSCSADKAPCSGGERGLYCGCTADSQCGGAGVGCGSDTCCHPQPTVVRTVPAGNAINVCRNIEIKADFDQKMNIGSFNGNFLVVSDYGSSVCPAGTKFISQKDPGDAHNFCAVEGRVSGVHAPDGSATSLRFSPKNALDPDRKFYAVMLNSEEVDSSKKGIKSFWGLGLFQEDSFGELSELDINIGYAWSFKTFSDNRADKGYCLIDNIKVSPNNYLFKTAVNDPAEEDSDRTALNFDVSKDRDKLFVAEALNNKGEALVSTEGYAWNWSWQADFDRVIKIESGVNGMADNERLIAAADNVADGQALLEARITVTKSLFGSAAPVGSSRAGQADVRVFICDNPWPPAKNDGQWLPWSDRVNNCTVAGGSCPNTGFEFYYCRDNKAAGTLDDLPAILSGSAVIRPKSSILDMLKEFYFFREAVPEAAGGFAVEDALSGGTVDASWNTVPGAVSYKVYYGRRSGNYDKFMNVVTNSATITGLENGTQYYFALTSTNDRQAESALSEEIMVTPTDEQPPAKPENVSAIPGNGQATLKWRSNDNSASSFKIYYGLQTGGYSGSAEVNQSGSGDKEQVVKGLQNGKKYYFAITALDESGNESAKSAEVSAVVGN